MRKRLGIIGGTRKAWHWSAAYPDVRIAGTGLLLMLLSLLSLNHSGRLIQLSRIAISQDVRNSLVIAALAIFHVGFFVFWLAAVRACEKYLSCEED